MGKLHRHEASVERFLVHIHREGIATLFVLLKGKNFFCLLVQNQLVKSVLERKTANVVAGVLTVCNKAVGIIRTFRSLMPDVVFIVKSK